MLNIDDIRQLRIVHCMIQKRTTGTPEEFASMLCVSRRKMYYILDKLKGLGAQVVYSRTERTFYYLKKFDLDISIKIMTKENNEWQEISGIQTVIDKATKNHPSPPFTSHHLNLKIAFTLKTYYEG